MNDQAATDASGPLTVIATWRIKPGSEAEFEA